MLIVVTGGTSGIGLSSAIKLLELNHNVILIGHNRNSQNELSIQLKKWAANFELLYFDIADLDQVKTHYEKIKAKWGIPDVIINNAGATTYETFADMEIHQIEREVSVNFGGATLISKIFLNDFIHRKSGHIINVSSIAGDIVLTPNIMYMASKQALNAWSEALKIELEPFMIKVSLVCPGRVDTAFFDHPTFKKRLQRPEMKSSLSADTVAKKIIQLIDRPKNKVYIPHYYFFISWIYRAIPGIKELVFRSLLRKRINDYYRR